MTLERDAFEIVRKLVRDRAAIVLEDGKEYLVESRLEALAHSSGLASVNELCRRLPRGPEALRVAVVEAMTTNETSFFRDQHPFEALDKLVFPDLIAKRAHQRKLRIWCAACSTGQEPYSVAMLLDERFPQVAGWTIQIYATDIAAGVLERARTARYSKLEVDRGLSTRRVERHFVREGHGWQLRESIRRRVQFAELNLVAPWPPMETFDLILLRNVLIYFDTQTKRRILPWIHAQLAGDGYLMLGGSENIGHETNAFERIAVPRSGLLRPCRPSVEGEVG
jgi:chemotaxis protein methyltransferase CheR